MPRKIDSHTRVRRDSDEFQAYLSDKCRMKASAYNRQDIMQALEDRVCKTVFGGDADYSLDADFWSTEGEGVGGGPDNW